MKKEVEKKDVFQELATFLKSKLSAKPMYQSQHLMHICSEKNLNSAIWLHAAKEHCGLQYSRFSVIHEQPTTAGEIKYVVSSYAYVNKLLQEKFGGYLGLNNAWILYNEPRSSTEYGIYGFRAKSLPSAKEICEFIEKAVNEEPSLAELKNKELSFEEKLAKFGES